MWPEKFYQKPQMQEDTLIINNNFIFVSASLVLQLLEVWVKTVQLSTDNVVLNQVTPKVRVRPGRHKNAAHLLHSPDGGEGWSWQGTSKHRLVNCGKRELIQDDKEMVRGWKKYFWNSFNNTNSTGETADLEDFNVTSTLTGVKVKLLTELEKNTLALGCDSQDLDEVQTSGLWKALLLLQLLLLLLIIIPCPFPILVLMCV